MENIEKFMGGLFAVAFLVIGFNFIQISQLKGMASGSASKITAQAVEEMSTAIDVAPKGIPRVYGSELGVSYDDVSSKNQQKADLTIRKLGALDKQISLGSEDLKRYISVAGKISCEYCCGVESIIFSDGKPACSCEHSFAMRGLAKYLIKNHNNEYTNDEILEELGKWKTLFFPSQMAKKAAILQQNRIELNYINLASNKYRNIENA